MEIFPVADLFWRSYYRWRVAGGVLAEIAPQPVPPPEVFY